MTTGGLSSTSLNPNKYRWLDIPTAVVNPTSNDCQSTFTGSPVIAFGVIILLINAVSSLLNALFLNPSDVSDIWPKLEFELVTDASLPDSAEKWRLNPIANTDTICMIASFFIEICAVCQPVLYTASESRW